MKLSKLGIVTAAMLAVGAFAAPGTAKAGGGVSINVPGFSLYFHDDDRRRHYRHRHYRGRHYGYRHGRSRCGRASGICAYKWGRGARMYYRCMRNYNCR